MATKKASADIATPMTTVAADLAHKLLTFVEQHATVQDTKDGPWLTTAQRSYFGVKLNQTIVVKNAEGLPVRSSLEAMWNAKMRQLVQSGALPMPLDLGWSMGQAQQQRRVFSFMITGKQDGPNKGKKYGLKFWTAENPKAAESRGETVRLNQPEW